MLPSERIRVGLFLGAVLAVYLLAGLSLLGLLLERAGRLRRPRRFVLLARRLILSLALLGFGCMAYGYFVEPYRLEVTRVTIASPKLPKGTGPIRIAHLSDLHSDPKPRLEKRLPEAVAGEKPHLIVFTGDAANSRAGVPVFKSCLTRLAEIAPVYAVKGNWDAWFRRGDDLFGGTGARELDGDAERLEIAGAPLWIAGLAVDSESRLDDLLSRLPSSEFSLFLHHYPDVILDVAAKGADLHCAGHTHGGQVALPFYGALMTLSKFDKRFERGLHRVEKTWLYVNRGIGMEGGRAPRVRFCSRPELTVIEIVPAG
jgi:predicted MPP superfamily phosphohydrolase